MSDIRDRILGNTDGKKPAATVRIPEWSHEELGVRRLSLRERLAFEAAHGAFENLDRRTDPAGYNRWLVRYCIATTTDLEGVKIFHPEDEEELANKSATAIERLVLSALKVNIVTAEEIRDLGNASGEVRNGASPSASPVTSD